MTVALAAFWFNLGEHHEIKGSTLCTFDWHVLRKFIRAASALVLLEEQGGWETFLRTNIPRRRLDAR